MEINSSCLGTVGKTIAFDLYYLLAICIHERLVFIIIVFFIFITVYLWLYPGIFCQVYFPFCASGLCVIWAWPYEKHPMGDARQKKCL